MKPILMINRRPHPGQFSIENIFTTLAKHLRKNNCDVVQYVSPLYSKGLFSRLYNAVHVAIRQIGVCHIVGDVTYLSLFLKRKNLVVTFHDLNIYERKSGVVKFFIGLVWYRIPLVRAKRVTAISEFTCQKLREYFGVAPGRVQVIPNPIPGEFTFEGKKKIDPAGVIDVLQIGVKQNKNLTRVISALEALSSQYLIRLTIVGQLHDRSSLDGSGKLQILNHFDLSLEEIVELYRQTHLVLFASTYEGFGMPVVEAQAVGRPVVTSHLEPMLSVSGGAAQFVDPLSISDIAEGVKQLIENPELVDDLVDRGLENAERYSIECIAEQYLKLYEQVD